MYLLIGLFNANAMEQDADRIANGLEPIHIPKLFNNYQQNRYRIWSEAFKDVQALRQIGYSELDIMSMLKGRRAFSEKELGALMQGIYMPANVPKLTLADNNAFIAQVKEISRERGINYLPNEFFDYDLLTRLKSQWIGVPLGISMDKIEDEIGVPFNIRIDKMKEDQETYQDILKEELQEKKIEEKEKIKEFKERQKNIENKKVSSAPIGTPPLETEIFTASRVYPTISGSEVNQASGLTGTEEALLDPMEKLIAQRQNQGLGSLA